MIKKLILLLSVVMIAVVVAFAVMKFTDTAVDNPDKVEVDLYFSTKDAMYLKAESRVVKGDNLYRNTIQELIKGPESPTLSRTIPDGVKINEIKVKNGTTYLDFNRALVENHWGGSTGEILTVYSIVNTMAQFPEIDRVQILIEGEEIETLAGHLDLLKPLEPDKRLIKEE